MDSPMYCHECEKLIEPNMADDGFAECPNCGSTRLDEARQCDGCGEWFWIEKLTKDGKHWFCQECKENK